jgi:hypothetical protein
VPRVRLPAIKISTAGCVLWLFVLPATWLLLALLPAAVLDDPLGEVLHARWTLWQSHPTVISVPPGTKLAVEIQAPERGRYGLGPLPEVINCTTRDGDGDEIAQPPQTIVATPHGQKEIVRPYTLDTRSGRLSVHCTWSGFDAPVLVRAGTGWFGILAKACQLLWIGLVTFGMLLVLRRIVRRRRAKQDVHSGPQGAGEP